MTIGDVVSGSVFNDGGKQLTGTGTLNLTSGTFKLGLAADATTFPAFATNNITTGTTIEYAATAAQTVKAITYSNLTISGSGAKTAANDITVDGILYLNSANASATVGCLDMGATYTLNMGASATTTGTGDVTGIVKRTQLFDNNIGYSFGNQYTTVTFIGISGGTKPGWLSCKIAIGAVPSWKSTAIKRVYTFAKDASATDEVITNLHYLDAELNGLAESQLVLWDAHNGPSFSPFEEHSKTNHDEANNWVGLSGRTVNYLAPTSALDNKQWSLAVSATSKNVWNGTTGTPTRWDVAGNWSLNRIPLTTDDVLIPTAPSNYPVLTLSVEVKSLELESGASIDPATFNITINGSAGAWTNDGTLTLGTGSSAVTFSHGILADIVSISGSGTNNFNNLTVNASTYLQPANGSYLKIGGTVTAGSGSIIDLKATTNTVEYNGSSQSILNLVGPASDIGYSNLVINSTGTTSLPATLNVMHNFTLTSGTVAAAALSTIDILGNVVLTAGTFTASSSTINLPGNWTNNGATFTPETGTVNFYNTTAAQAINGTAVSQTFNNILIDKSAAALSVGGSTTALTVNDLSQTSGDFTPPATLTVNGNATLTSGTFTAGTNTNLKGNWTNNGANFASGSGTVTFNGTSAQTIYGANTFNSLTINNSSGVTANAGQTVNGVLDLQSANASLTKGCLSMTDPYELLMGPSATTTGIGDVSGYITRTSFVLGQNYTFGNPYTLMNFTVGPLPTSVTLEVYLTGAKPSWMGSNVGIWRYYDVTQSGGTADTRLRFNAHYLDSELGGATGANLDLFDHHESGPYTGLTHDHGRSDNSTGSDPANWVGFSNVGLVFLGTYVKDDHLWTLGDNSTGSTSIWLGGSPSGPTDWNLPGNWQGGVPAATSDVHIPATTNTPVLPDGSTAILSIEIQSGGILEATSGNPTLTISGGTDAWVNSGTFNAGNSTVTFTNAAATITGTTNFNNVTVANAAKLTPGASNIMRVEGVLTLTGTGAFDAHTSSNTVEYNGASQTIVNPNGATAGYFNLILSGSGVKTLPGSSMAVLGDLTLSGSASATPTNGVEVTGTTTLSGTSSLILGADNLVNSGAIILNGGTFSTSAAGYTETVGTLNLAENSTIALGADAKVLTFAASNGISWTSGKMLTITGWTGSWNGTTGTAGQIFAGISGLTAGQLAQVQFYDGSKYFNSTILGTGEVVPLVRSDAWTWTGTTSSIWSDVGNWSSLGGGVPPSGANVVIADVSTDPLVSTAVLFNDLTINSGGLLTITSSGAVTVNGTLTVTGTDGLIVNSDASTSGSLIVLGSSSGDVTYNRYLASSRWYIVSSPVNIAQPIGAWLPTSNVASNTANTSQYAMAEYIESTNLWGPYYTTGTSSSFVPGLGYLMRLKSGATNVSFKGYLNTGTVSIPILRSVTGWNGVGNPYTSAIGINAASGTSNFLAVNSLQLDPSYGAVYLWDGTVSKYKVINNTGVPQYGGLLSENYVQAGQGFLVKSVSGGGSVLFTPEMRSVQSSITLKSVQVSSWNRLVLQCAYSEKNSSTYLNFREDMTPGLDPTYDAGILKSDPNFELYTRLVEDNGIDFAVQCLPTNTWTNLSIPVGIDLLLGGEVAFSVSNSDVPVGYYPILVDNLLKINTYLKTPTDTYTINLPAGTSGAGRFFLTFGDGSSTGTEVTVKDPMRYLKIYPNPASDVISIQVEGYSGKIRLQIVNTQGTIVRELRYELSGKERHTFEIADITFSKGLYLVKAIYSDGTEKTERLIIVR